MKYFGPILFSFILSSLIYSPLYAKDGSTTIRKQVKQLMIEGPLLVMVDNKTTERCFTPESFFLASIKKMLNTESEVCYKKNGLELAIISDNPFYEKNYKMLFGEEAFTGDNEYKKTFKCAMANSICNFYGISIEELLHLRQKKVVVNKTKKEINRLFDESLEIINSWTDEANNYKPKIDEAKLAKLIADELVKKQNEPLAPDAQIPTVPTLL